MATMAALLPQHEGYFPYFLIYAGSSALIHTAVCYLSRPSAALKQFRGSASPPPNGLLARVYGVKNVYTSLIRLYAAYYIHIPQLYDLAILTFVGVLFLYGMELFVYRTVRPKEGIFPFVTAGTGLVWMMLQRDWYQSS